MKYKHGLGLLAEHVRILFPTARSGIPFRVVLKTLRNITGYNPIKHLFIA
jgi:hypothetical protein